MNERSDQSTSTLTPGAAALILWLVFAEAWPLRRAGAGIEDQLKLIHAPALLAIATAGLEACGASDTHGHRYKSCAGAWPSG